MFHASSKSPFLVKSRVLKSKLSPDKTLSTRVKPEALEKDVRQFRGNLDKIQQNCGILQVIIQIDKSRGEMHFLFLSKWQLVTFSLYNLIVAIPQLSSASWFKLVSLFKGNLFLVLLVIYLSCRYHLLLCKH